MPSIVSPSDGGPAVVHDPARPTLSPSPTLERPEFLASKVTEEEWRTWPESAQKTMIERAKDLQADYTKKTTELAQQRKTLESQQQSLKGLWAIKEQLDADPKLAEHLDKSLADYKSGKLSKQDLKDDWDSLKAEADQDGLRVLRAIEKKFGSDGVAAELKELRSLVSTLVSGTQQSRRSQLEAEIRQLPPAYKSLAEEHQEKLLRLGMTPSFAQDSALDLLIRVAPRSAYEEAFLKVRSADQDAQTKRAQELGGFPSLAGAPETPTLNPEDIIESRDPRHGKGVRFSNVISRVLGEVKRSLPVAG